MRASNFASDSKTLQRIQSFIEKIPQGSVINKKGYTILHLAAETGHASVVNLVGRQRLSEFKIRSQDGLKPHDVATLRRINAIKNRHNNEVQEANNVLGVLDTIKFQCIRSRKK